MDPQQHIYISANALARQITSIADNGIKPYGISTSYAFLLVTIYESPGLSQKQIGELLNFAPSTLTRFTDKLVSKGFLKREKNGKEVVSVLTPEGSRLCEDLLEEIKRINNRIEDELGNKFTDTLNRMMTHGLQILSD